MTTPCSISLPFNKRADQAEKISTKIPACLSEVQILPQSCVVSAVSEMEELRQILDFFAVVIPGEIIQSGSMMAFLLCLLLLVAFEGTIQREMVSHSSVHNAWMETLLLQILLTDKVLIHLKKPLQHFCGLLNSAAK